MRVYYNEFDKEKCAALQALMDDGIIRKGDIDDRSIGDVRGSDLQGYERCHFFAGVGLWDVALDLAGWEEGRGVWTGSCPCQPFSTAGRQKGKKDDRHLWPEWLRLISKCKPPVIFGEQVNAAITHGWLDDVYQGLEAYNYAVGAVTMPASAVGAPHRRERLWFVGNATSKQSACFKSEIGVEKQGQSGRGCSEGTLGDSEHYGQPAVPESGSEGQAIYDNQKRANRSSEFTGAGSTCDVADTNGERLQGERAYCNAEGWERQNIRQAGLCGGTGNWIETGEWINCPDGKARLVEPTIPLLVNGFPERDGIIHCAGDAIVPQLAAEFIRAFKEVKLGNLSTSFS